MKTSPYFNETLFFDLDPATDESYANAHHLFETDEKKTLVGLHIQSTLENKWHAQPTKCTVESVRNYAPQSPSTDSTPHSKPGHSVDRVRYTPRDPSPPVYNGRPGLQLRDYSNSKDLHEALQARFA